jgi:hypothetical protein
MNYSNFTCRISAPRSVPAQNKKSAPPLRKKSRRSIRRIAIPAAAALLVFLAVHRDVGAEEPVPRPIPAAQSNPPTSIVTCIGLVVALAQLRWLGRGDLVC